VSAVNVFSRPDLKSLGVRELIAIGGMMPWNAYITYRAPD
jgi:hypothetical protein